MQLEIVQGEQKKDLQQVMEETMTKVMVEQACAIAHKAIHNPPGQSEMIMPDGKKYAVQTTSGGLRHVVWGEIDFMQQNPNKKSLYALHAREGKKITWGIRNGQWIYIEGLEAEKIGIWKNGELTPIS